MNKFPSLVSQILKIFPRSRFEILVKETKASAHS